MKRCKGGSSHGTHLLIFFLAATVFCLGFHLIVECGSKDHELLFWWLTHLFGGCFMMVGVYLIWHNLVCGQE